MPPPSDDESLWASAPWTATQPLNNAQRPIIPGLQKHVPYVPGSTTLQTLTIYIPGTQPPPLPTPSPTPSDSTWILFIHGGAWRDPLVDASAFHPAATSLLLKNNNHNGNPIAGLVSINYRLSSHPNHPSSNPAHAAHHPDHIHDVLGAISFLQRARVATGRYVLAGHSCGATLAFQAVMDPTRWGLSGEMQIRKPQVVVGLNGLYDLAGFIKTPPVGYEGLREAYEEFTRGAFGDGEETWRAVCPATAREWVGEWVGEWEGERRKAVLVQSGEDGLVPRGQLEGMRGVLEREGVDVVEMEAGGGHDEMWERGEGRMAEVLWEVVLGTE
ncbi:Alpha/Beta hydrolase protein [Immersiella caudata]|uniref:Kynurenine formamidase n=1 Tax=Immersiella caudata TaxID=314043 RepID=A0AA40BTZ9_9PEZI|nr:Alpha/Beta hydrolase protein [Immersiella caudata]